MKRRRMLLGRGRKPRRKRGLGGPILKRLYRTASTVEELMSERAGTYERLRREQRKKLLKKKGRKRNKRRAEAARNPRWS